MHHSEHSSHLLNYITTPMAEFRDSLQLLGVFDLRFNGPLHTQTNSYPVSPIAKKLDRLLINNHILSIFPNAFTSFLPLLPSDHSPCLTDLAFQLSKVGTQPFRFLNYLTKHSTFLQVVSLAWDEAGSSDILNSSMNWTSSSVYSDELPTTRVSKKFQS